jgi:putative tricarboxylic transport membrane protein
LEILSHLGLGFGIALQPLNLLFALIGATLGTLIGVLPGIGPTATIAMLLPISTGMDPTTAIIMMAGIFYGSMYGGSTTAILINTPGEAASVITVLDGYQMTRQGRAGAALGMAAISSFIAGTFSVVGLMLLAPPLADFALSFGPPEHFSLMLLGLSVVISLAGKSLVKGLLSCAAGMIISMIGIDPIEGNPRLTFGITEFISGIDFISLIVGLFAIPEVLQGIEEKARSFATTHLKGIFPTWQDWKDSFGAIWRGSVIGFFVCLLPGSSGSVAAFLTYDLEKKLSKHPEKFGTGLIEGVAGPEGANNAATGGGMVPLLTLGIPNSAPLAVLLGALMIHGLRPGPLLFSKNPDFVWALIASMYIGNVMCLVLNLPMVGLWARLARIPFPFLGPAVLALCFVGTYGVRNNMFDVFMAALFGLLGYFMKKLAIPSMPMVLAVILGPTFEAALRQALTISKGSFSIFLTRPISLVILVAAACSIVYSLYSRMKVTRLISSGVIGSEEK